MCTANETFLSAKDIGKVGIESHMSRDLDVACDLVRKHGSDTLSYFALRDSGQRIFNDSRTAFISYRLWGKVALAGADPIGPVTEIPGLVAKFLQHSDSHGLAPCFLGASQDYVELYRRQGLSVLKVGEECLLRLPAFDVSNLKRKVRRAERHSLHLGIRMEMVAGSDVSPAHRRQALDVSDAWLRLNGGSEHGFSMTLGRFPDFRDTDTRVALAVQGGRVLGFLTFVPVYEVGGYSLDMMRRLPGAPNGLMEFLILQSARRLKDEGAKFISLNFAALANTRTIPEPHIITLTRRFAFESLSTMFQLKSLFTFNDKFRPDWVSRYAVFRSIRQAPMITLAIIQSEDPITLPWVRRH